MELIALPRPGQFGPTWGLPGGLGRSAWVWTPKLYLSNPFGHILAELIGAFKVLNQLGQETQDVQRKAWVREDTMETADYGVF